MTADPDDDPTLVGLAQHGDTEAFTTLLRRHDDKMRGVVWRLVESREAMDDVLQDAYLKAWRGLAGFRGDARFSTWLYRIVHTTTLDHLKAARRRRVVPLETAADRSVDDQTAVIADIHDIRAALAELPEDQLAVVTLVDGQGESYDDVALMLDINPGTVASRLHRGRAALRKRLAAGGGGRR